MLECHDRSRETRRPRGPKGASPSHACLENVWERRETGMQLLHTQGWLLIVTHSPTWAPPPVLVPPKGIKYKAHRTSSMG